MAGNPISDRLVYTPEELLESHPLEEPLVVGGQRYHGGFDASGQYVSPRTLNRAPAIKAWQEKLRSETDMALIDCPPDMFAENYPNIEQTKYLLSEGVREPVTHMLTHIGTVEGFGAVIRAVVIPDMTSLFVEPVDGTAMVHLPGLYEAHARDEAGFADEGGHQQMWYGVRDIAFESPDVGDPLDLIVKMMKPGSAGGKAMSGMAGSIMAPSRIVPEIDADLEAMITRMTGLLLIELLAAQTFKWGEAVVGDDRYCNDASTAARLVDYIRADEAPHVEYLKTVLTEMRSRTFIATDGRRLPGTEIIDRCWDYSMRQMFGLGGKRSERRAMIADQLDVALAGNRRKKAILANFYDLETPDPTVEEDSELVVAGR